MDNDFPREQVLGAYRNAPAPVRDAFSSPDTVDVISAIQATHKLHIDTAGLIGRYVGYMLVGLVEPAAFYDRLLGIGMSTEVATNIVREINTKVFQPLQKRMREDGASEKGETPSERPGEAFEVSSGDKGAADAVPEPSRAASVIPVRTPAAGVQPMRLEMTQPAVRPAAVPTNPAPVPAPTPSAAPAPVPAAPTQAPSVVTPLHARTMASDMELVQHGYDALQVSGMPLPPTSSLASPARSFQTASVPVTSSAPMPQPQEHLAPPSQTAPVPPPPPAYREPVVTAPVRLTPVDRSHPDAPITKEYGSDPYREPISADTI